MNRPTIIMSTLITACNGFIIYLLLSSEKFTGKAGQYLKEIWNERPSCLSSWANASIEFSDILEIVAALSLILSCSLVLLVIVIGLIFRDLNASGQRKAGPGVSMVIGAFVFWLWLCYLGASQPATSIQDLTMIELWLFNNKSGILFSGIFLNLISHSIAQDAVRFLSKKFGKEAFKNEFFG